MKKFMLCIMGSLIALFVVFWCCISYTVNYKKITCDTSVSPDKKYEVILQAVGEPEWPFGSASGRLVLKEGEDKISQTDFELHNDGASISSSCWKVTWHEDYVEIILSGEEQFDEQVILYFDGTKEIQQLTDVADIEVEYPSGERLDESRVITEQSFDVELNDWGEVQFVSYLPTYVPYKIGKLQIQGFSEPITSKKIKQSYHITQKAARSRPRAAFLRGKLGRRQKFSKK